MTISIQQNKPKMNIMKLKKRVVILIVFAICLACFNSIAQQKIAKGVVLDEDDFPLVGAKVIEIGNNNTTTTNEKGQFSLRLLKSSEIQISFVGKKVSFLKITNNLPVKVVMQSEMRDIKEVVVVGYGTVEKRDVTGAISSINSKSFENQPIVDINQAIQGQAAGVNVLNTSGTPGGGLDIQIRGISTIGSSNTPLYVIDGNIVQVGMDADSNPLSFINPSDVESIEILKDASAAAIYGSRGSNGVVLITTKTGVKGKAKINYNAKAGFQEVFNQIEMLSARDFATLAIESRNNDWVDRGNGANSPLDGDFLRPQNTKVDYFKDFLNSGSEGTDWQDAVFRKGSFQEHQLTVSGGSDNIRYLVSGSFLDNQGTMRNTGFKRYSARANIDADVSKKLKVSFKISPNYTNQDFLPSTGRFHSGFGGIVQSAILMNPMLDIYDPSRYTGYSTGILSPNGMQSMENPVAKINLIRDWRRNFNLISNGAVTYEINKFFDFSVTGGAIVRSNRRDYIDPSTIGAFGITAPRDNTIGSSQNNFYNWQTSAQLSYKQNFGKHRINAVAVHERQVDQGNLISANARSTWTDELIIVDSNLESVLRQGSSSITEWALSSWIGRVNYSFSNKYSVTGSIRADGSSKFADRWGIFPSGAVAWRISNEDFLKSARWLTDLKFRTSYGITGNNSIGNYTYMSFMGGSSYVVGSGGENIASGIRLNSYGNPDLSWEQTAQVDIGADLSILKRRISFVVDYYDKRTKNLLLNLQVPSNMGFRNILTNIGEVQNKGWEFTLDTRNLVKTFQWNSSFNISFNKQKVLELGPEGDPLWGDAVYLSNSHITQIGQPMGLFYGLKVLGIYKNQAEVDALPGISSGAAKSRPGEFYYQNVDDSDNEITLNDRTVIGNPQPDFVFGFSNTFNYKQFSLNVILRGAYGADILNLNFGSTPFSLNTNSYVGIKNRWQSEEEPGDGKIPRLALATRAQLGSTTLNSSYVEDGSFINIQNVTFGYELSKKFTDRLKANKLNILLSVNNLFMFTKYNGWNPEGGIYTDTTLSPGLDWGRYPLSRVYTLGLNLTF